MQSLHISTEDNSARIFKVCLQPCSTQLLATMLRLSAIILCLGLVFTAHGFQQSTSKSYQPGSTVDLDCGAKTLLIDNAVLYLDGGCPDSYSGDLRSQIADYCKDNGSTSSCSFTLADVLGSDPESCITKFDVGKICL